MTDKASMNRRQFLATSMTTSLALLAGCGSIAGDTETNATPTSTPTTTASGPPEFVGAALSGPAKVTLGEPFG